jgi:hypothetical protein
MSMTAMPVVAAEAGPLSVPGLFFDLASYYEAGLSPVVRSALRCSVSRASGAG